MSSELALDFEEEKSFEFLHISTGIYGCQTVLVFLDLKSIVLMTDCLWELRMSAKHDSY